MKKVFFAGAILFLMGGLKAQSLADARKLLYYERYDGAARQLHALLKADPNNSEAWWLLTQAYLHKHQLQRIIDSLQLMPTSITEQPFALCAKGQILLEQHQKDSAAMYFELQRKRTR